MDNEFRHYDHKQLDPASAVLRWLRKNRPDVIPVAAVVVVIVGVVIYLSVFHSDKTNEVNITAYNKTHHTSVTTSQSGTSTNLHVPDLWKSSVHGLLALKNDGTEDYLLLVNPNNGNVLARALMPKSGAYSGRRYTAGFALGITNYEITDALNNKYRYEAISFAPASNGSTDVGYYDLETGKVYDATPKSSQQNGQSITEDSDPAFDSNNPDLLVFTRTTAGTGFTQGEQSGGQPYAYNLVTKQTQPYSGTTSGNCRAPLQYAPDSGYCELMGQGPSAGVGFANSGMESLGVDPTPSQNNPNNYANDSQGATYTPVETTSGGQTNNIDCDPDQWLPADNMLCDSDDGTNILIVNMSSFSLGSDGSYQVPSSIELLPTNQRYNGNAIASPSGKTIDFVSNGNIYQVPVTGGSPALIMNMNGLDAVSGTYNSDLTLLSWR